jgi:hypothetical protein
MAVGDHLAFDDNKIWHTGCDAYVSVKVTEKIWNHLLEWFATDEHSRNPRGLWWPSWILFGTKLGIQDMM